MVAGAGEEGDAVALVAAGLDGPADVAPGLEAGAEEAGTEEAGEDGGTVAEEDEDDEPPDVQPATRTATMAAAADPAV